MAIDSNYGSYENYDFNTAGNDTSYVAPHASGTKYLKGSTMPFARSILSNVSAEEIKNGALDHYTPEELIHEILLAYTDQPEAYVKADGKTRDEIRSINNSNLRQSGKRWKRALDNIVLLGQRNPEVAKMLVAIADASDKPVDIGRYKDAEQYTLDNDIILNYYKQNDPEMYDEGIKALKNEILSDMTEDIEAQKQRSATSNDFSTRINDEFKDVEYDPSILATKIKKPDAIKFKLVKAEDFEDNNNNSDMQAIYEQVDDILAEIEAVDSQIEEQTRKLNALRKRNISGNLTMQSDLLEDSLQELKDKKQVLLKQLPLIDEDGNVTYPGLEGEDDEVDTDELFKKIDDLDKSMSERMNALNSKDVDKIMSNIQDFKEDATAHKEEVNKQIAESDKQLHDKLAAKQKEDVLSSNEDMSDIDIDLSDITGFDDDGDEDIDIEDTEDMPDIDIDLSDITGFDDTERNETTKNIVKGITPKYGA